MIGSFQRCPVCEGRGNVPQGWRWRMTAAVSTNPEVCPTCGGDGVLLCAVVDQRKLWARAYFRVFRHWPKQVVDERLRADDEERTV